MVPEVKSTSVVLWTVQECAKWMSMTPLAIRGLLRRREIPAPAVIKIGRRVRIRADMVQEWVLSGKTV